MPTAQFCFHDRLLPLLRHPEDGGERSGHFIDSPAVKDPIEAFGVPHTEIDRLFANGRPVDFSYRLRPGDRIDLYPPGAPIDPQLDAAGAVRLCPQPPRPLRFVLDVHLGTLARHLRLLGFDSLYRHDYVDEEIVELGVTQQRIILTRDRGLLRRRVVRFGYLLRSQQPDEQLRELLRRFRMADAIVPLSRCARCNGQLEPVAKAQVRQRLEPKTERYYETFARCDACGQIYWQGSHYQQLRNWVATLLPSQTG